MVEQERKMTACIGYSIRALALSQRITISAFRNFFDTSKDVDVLAKKLTGISQMTMSNDGFNYTVFPFVPNTKYPPIVKAFVLTPDELPVDRLPTPAELGFMTFVADDGTYCTINDTKKFYGSVQCTFLPDLRDIERMIYGENVMGYLSNVRGLPLSDQLEQEINEATICKNQRLPIATIATLSIAMETACKLVLEKREVSYLRNKDGLNELLNTLVKNGLLSETDRQACLSLKGLRNAVNHAHTGIVTEQNAEMFFVTGQSLIGTILQSAMHD
jgi:uncharacterized protein YutE (UPF0331/DUF86 family)